MFPPEGEVALMFLKSYTGLSDDGRRTARNSRSETLMPLTECPYVKPSGALPTAVGNVTRGRGQRRPQPWATLSAAMCNAPQALQQRENASPKRLGIWEKRIYIIDIQLWLSLFRHHHIRSFSPVNVSLSRSLSRSA